MTAKPLRSVLDTNVLIAACMRPQSVPGLALAAILQAGHVLRSEAVVKELEETIQRTKFDRYQDLQQRLRFVSNFLDVTTPVAVTIQIHDCRDPRDNIFLSLALAGQADLILTGDADLLALHPWRTIPILTPAEFLARSAPRNPESSQPRP